MILLDICGMFSFMNILQARVLRVDEKVVLRDMLIYNLRKVRFKNHTVELRVISHI